LECGGDLSFGGDLLAPTKKIKIFSSEKKNIFLGHFRTAQEADPVVR
jgi:hypothetical protein